MLMMNVSEEQSVNTALQLAGTSGSAAFRFAKWIYKRVKEKEKAMDGAAEKLIDACSDHRGGWCATSDRDELKKIIRDLAGTNDARLHETEFQWTGKQSDLAYFWKRGDAKSFVTLPKTTVDALTDDIRLNVMTVLTKARMDGLVGYEGNEYILTEKGSKAIFNTDFVVKRLKDECHVLGIKDVDLLADACSAYRGGFCAGEDREALKELIRNLAGTEDARLDGSNFLWTGNKTDLAYFWRKTDSTSFSELLDSLVADVPEKQRKMVVSVLTKARFDGLIDYNGEAYTLTEKGEKAIFNTDFVLNRLRDECRALGIASEVLEKDRESLMDDKIDAKLNELGINPEKYAGCNRITLNVETLFIKHDKATGQYRFYVPYTQRRDTICLPQDDVIRLDDRTFVAFLRPNRVYPYNAGGEAMLLPTEEVKSKFDDKGKVPGKELAGAIEKAEQQAVAETDPLNCHPSVGEKWVVFETADDPHEYIITAGWKDFDDTVHFNMSSADGSRGELLLPEDSLGEIAFHSEEEGYRYISQNPERYAKDSHILSYQTNKEPTVHLVSKDAWQEEDAVYLIGNLKGRGRDGALMIPKEEGIPQADGSLSVSLQRQNYAIKTGEYARPVSRGGADHFLKSRQLTKPVSQTVRKAEEKTAEAVANAAIEGGSSFSDDFFNKSVRRTQRIMEETLKGAKTTTETAATVTKTAAHAIPPVEGVSATVKTVMTAVSKAGEAISAANSISQVRTR